MKTDIFGIKFDNMTTTQIAKRLLENIGSSKRTIVFTPNPEIVMESAKDKELFEVLQEADIISADGIGIVWASKYFGAEIKERASGYDIVQELFVLADSEPNGVRAFFLGGTKDSVTKAAANTEQTHTGVKVYGAQDGYFSPSDTDEIIAAINAAEPDLLLVGLGSPKQEKWVAKNAEKLNATVIIAVGGSFDVMSGNVKRAPVTFQKLGLEWLYRLLTQPKRIKRMAKLPLFVIKVLMKK